MHIHRQPAPDRAWWVGRFAGLIQDPVRRLKFLKLVTGPLAPVSTERGWKASLYFLLVLLLLGLPASIRITRSARSVAPIAVRTAMLVPASKTKSTDGAAERIPMVWQVEQAGDSETYSNGLRIDNRFSVTGRPRSYVAFRAGAAQDRQGVRRSEPAGIVFHTTESPQVPLEERHNGRLKLIGQSQIEYARRKRAYHFVIDRFGRVYRVVQDSGVANHAGYSVWSDQDWVYLNLNESFLGVSFEAQTESGEVNPVQVRAAATLTEMLRSRYRIPAENCVTHGQVSVNPSNMRIGYHTDWASTFPFEELGLPNNYSRAPPALWMFGFECDRHFLESAGARIYAGVELAEHRLQEGAAESGLPLAEYRKSLQRSYREKIAALGRQTTAEEQP